MSNPWKLATIGIAVTTITALTSGLTTAYFMRPTPVSESPVPSSAAQPSALARRAMVAPVVQAVRTALAPRVVRAVAHAPSSPAAPARTEPAFPPVVERTESPVTTVAKTTPGATLPADCASGGGRVLRIAKPGALGALLGAGLGAAGGAIVNGGKGAGQGALLGGLLGVAAGGAYGAYKARNECGTIFGATADTDSAR